MGAGRPPLLPLVALVETLLPRSTLRLSHFIGHGFDVALRIVAGIAGLRMSNDGRARKSTISQEVIVVIALCWPEDDVDYSVVYFNIEVGFGRLLHWSLTDPSASAAIIPFYIRRSGWPSHTLNKTIHRTRAALATRMALCKTKISSPRVAASRSQGSNARRTTARPF